MVWWNVNNEFCLFPRCSGLAHCQAWGCRNSDGSHYCPACDHRYNVQQPSLSGGMSDVPASSLVVPVHNDKEYYSSECSQNSCPNGSSGTSETRTKKQTGSLRLLMSWSSLLALLHLHSHLQHNSTHHMPSVWASVEIEQSRLCWWNNYWKHIIVHGYISHEYDCWTGAEGLGQNETSNSYCNGLLSTSETVHFAYCKKHLDWSTNIAHFISTGQATWIRTWCWWTFR